MHTKGKLTFLSDKCCRKLETVKGIIDIHFMELLTHAVSYHETLWECKKPSILIQLISLLSKNSLEISNTNNESNSGKRFNTTFNSKYQNTLYSISGII